MTSPLLMLPLLSLLASVAAGVSDPAPGLADATDRDQWVSLLSDAKRAVAEAERQLEAAKGDYARMKRHRKARGDRKEAIRSARDDAEAALADAQRRLEDLLESARRAGVPPGWVREALEDAEPQPASLP